MSEGVCQSTDISKDYWDGWIDVHGVERSENVILYMEHLESGDGIEVDGADMSDFEEAQSVLMHETGHALSIGWLDDTDIAIGGVLAEHGNEAYSGNVQGKQGPPDETPEHVIAPRTLPLVVGNTGGLPSDDLASRSGCLSSPEPDVTHADPAQPPTDNTRRK